MECLKSLWHKMTPAHTFLSLNDQNGHYDAARRTLNLFLSGWAIQIFLDLPDHTASKHIKNVGPAIGTTNWWK